MVQCIAAFLDACYLIHCADINKSNITKLQMAIRQFHEHQEIFHIHAVRPKGFSLLHQHSLTHYPHQIREFGVPLGLCSSITESRHITAVKQPWRWSNHHNALGQMLLTNQRLDKLKAVCNNFVHRGLLPPSHLSPPKPMLMQDKEEDGGPVDERVIGTVTLAKTRHTFQVQLLLGYTNFGDQNKIFLTTLWDWLIMSRSQIWLNSHAASFMTNFIQTAQQQMK